MYYKISEILHQEDRDQVNAIVMGDFNSIVGKGSTDKVVGPFGLSRKTERGKMLIDFCMQHDLVVMNTWFKKRKTKLYIWKSPGDRNPYQIDYIMVKQRFRNSIRDVKTLPGVDIDSDHNLLVAEVQTSNSKSWGEETKMEFGTNQEQRKPCDRSDRAKIQSNRWSNQQRRR